MIHIDFEVPTDEGWLAWVRRARAARRECLQPGLENPASKINDRIYKEQRALLLNAFHKKCAYCESPIPANLRWGDIDHYRPKGRVTDQDGTPVFSKQKRHKGYYWLAYRWENLLPCCPACNRPGTGPDGLNSGKWDRFPTANKFWAENPRDLRKEIPLLLHPYFDDPGEHLLFHSTGAVGPKTLRGEVTIDILGLNRDGLRDGRRDAYENSIEVFSSLHQAYARRSEQEASKYEAKIDAILSGKTYFSAACRAALHEAREDFDKRRRRHPWLN